MQTSQLKQQTKWIVIWAMYDILLGLFMVWVLTKYFFETGVQLSYTSLFLVSIALGCLWSIALVKRAIQYVQKGNMRSARTYYANPFFIIYQPFHIFMTTLPLKLWFPIPLLTGVSWAMLFSSVIIGSSLGILFSIAAVLTLAVVMLVFSLGFLLFWFRLISR